MHRLPNGDEQHPPLPMSEMPSHSEDTAPHVSISEFALGIRNDVVGVSRGVRGLYVLENCGEGFGEGAEGR